MACFEVLSIQGSVTTNQVDPLIKEDDDDDDDVDMRVLALALSLVEDIANCLRRHLVIESRRLVSEGRDDYNHPLEFLQTRASVRHESWLRCLVHRTIDAAERLNSFTRSSSLSPFDSPCEFVVPLCTTTIKFIQSECISDGTTSIEYMMYDDYG